MSTNIHVEVFVASQVLGRRQEKFTAEALRREVEQLFDDTRPGVSTHILAHCVANAPRNAATVYNYLWRLEQGLFRVFDPSRDRPHASRANAACLPLLKDVPTEYIYLFSEERSIVSARMLQQCGWQHAQDYSRNNLSLLDDDDPLFPHAGENIRERGFVLSDELYRIARWKSRRRADLVKANPDHVIEKVTKLALALKDTDPGYAVDLLTVLKGVGVPMASVVLTVADPQEFGIIDIWTWQTLNRWQPDRFPWKDTSGFSVTEFLRYLETMRELARHGGLLCREVDMALWYVARKPEA
jgi:hypothetical protein